MILKEIDEPNRTDTRRLLDEHLTDMCATSPAESVHALDQAALSGPGITFWSARHNGVLSGCAAVKVIGLRRGEIKSMRTSPSARGRGIASGVLVEILSEAQRRNCTRLFLETGSDKFFAPARRLYAKHGFTDCRTLVRLWSRPAS